MAALKSWRVVLLFFFLFHCFSYASFVSYSSTDHFTSWYNNSSIGLEIWCSDGDSTIKIRPILFINNGSISPPFGFGFFANGSTTGNDNFYLAVFLFKQPSVSFETDAKFLFLDNPPVVVWCANRDRPVGENAVLDFTADAGLGLKDADGSHVWSANTFGDSASRLNITHEGNLILGDGKNSVMWQSFDYPTDTWLPNQNLSFGKGLTSRNSPSNLGTGLYSLSVTRDGLDAFIGSDPPQRYHRVSYPVIYNGKIILGRIEITNHAWFKLNTEMGFRYIVLEPTGQLNFYDLGSYERQRDLLSPDPFGFRQCDSPNACGNYGVCSYNNDGQCTCPVNNASHNYFTPFNDSQPNLGCKLVNPLSCQHKQLHTLLELKNVTYYDLEPLLSNVDLNTCKKECLDDCSCKAALFSDGNCSLPSELYTLKQDVIFIKHRHSLTFIKVQHLSHKKKSTLVAELVPTLSICLVIIIFVAGYYHHKMQINAKYEEDRDFQVIGALKRFSFLKLKSATGDFQVRLGRGGFGSVFEGDLGDGTKVAVKLLDSMVQGRKEFLAEVNTIGSTNHFNLVKLIGYCVEKSNRLLVYECMSNGSLDKWIFNQDKTQALSWELRRKIIIGLAKGLEYLHVHCNPSIIHFDIKPQNILLDEDFNVKISDFGLAKLIDRGQSQVLTVLRGTPGYVAPELFKGTNISVKADVFSFGIVILETVFGRKNLGSPQSDPLVEIVKEKAEAYELHNLVDGYNEIIQLDIGEAMKMIKIALWCLQAHNRRPSMSTILKILEGSMDMESISEYCFVTAPHIETDLQANSALSTPPVASIVSGPR